LARFTENRIGNRRALGRVRFLRLGRWGTTAFGRGGLTTCTSKGEQQCHASIATVDPVGQPEDMGAVHFSGLLTKSAERRRSAAGGLGRRHFGSPAEGHSAAKTAGSAAGFLRYNTWNAFCCLRGTLNSSSISKPSWAACACKASGWTKRNNGSSSRR